MKVAVVTGGSEGIGLKTVEMLKSEGYHVVFCGRNEEKGNNAAAKTGARFIKCDVSDRDQVKYFYDQVEREFDRLDVIVANVGCTSNVGKVCDIPDEDWHRVLGVNTTGTWYSLKFGVPLIQKGGRGGAVIIISSAAGFRAAAVEEVHGHSPGGHYSVSKAAINSLTQVMALEYADEKIRVNAICPTGIETENVIAFRKKFIADSKYSDDEKKCILSDMARNPMVAPGDDIPQPEDVAHLVIFLASDKAKFINGALIPLDGGFTCR